jgi:hypothetical protein
MVTEIGEIFESATADISGLGIVKRGYVMGNIYDYKGGVSF